MFPQRVGRDLTLFTMLQTRCGTAAQGVTQEEFDNIVLVKVQKAMEAVREENMDYFVHEGKELPVLYSFDNDRAHLGDHAKIPDIERVPLPPRSPDMHRTVERAIGIVTREFFKALRRSPNVRTLKQYKALLKAVAKEFIKAEAIMADVLGLQEMHKETAASVEEGGPAGGWASREV
jgi:hypothetical protein